MLGSQNQGLGHFVTEICLLGPWSLHQREFCLIRGTVLRGAGYLVIVLRFLKSSCPSYNWLVKSSC